MAKRPRPSLIALAPPGGDPAAEGPTPPGGSAPPGRAAEEGGGAGAVRREVASLAHSLGIPVEGLERAVNDALLRHARPPAARCEPWGAGAEAGALAVRTAFLAAAWPARTGARLWYEGVAAPTLAAWAHWAAMAEAGLPRRDRAG